MNSPYLHLALMLLNLYCALVWNTQFAGLNFFAAGFALSTALQIFVLRKLSKSDQ